MNHKSLLLLFAGCLIAVSTPAQTIRNVRIETQGESLVVVYDLEGDPCIRYDIGLRIVERGGRVHIPMGVSGNMRSVMPGQRHRIFWQVTRDVESLQGEVAAELSILHEEVVPVLRFKPVYAGGGSSNAFLSMILPGTGDIFVNGDETPLIRPGYIMLAYAGSVLMAYSSHSAAKEHYTAYRQAVQQYEMDSHYEKAVYYRDNARFYTFLAGTIWVADVLRVAVKGSMNRKQYNAQPVAFTAGIKNGVPAAGLQFTF
jgi:hypothetical protein